MNRALKGLVQKVICKCWLFILIATITTLSTPFLYTSYSVSRSKSNVVIHTNTFGLVKITTSDAPKTITAVEATVPDAQFNPNYTFQRYTGVRYTKEHKYVNVTAGLPLGNAPLHVLSREKQYAGRMSHVREQCQEYPAGGYSSIIDMKRFVADHNHKAIMCVVPKNACTTWKSIWLYLIGGTTLAEAFHFESKNLDLEYGKIKSMTRISLSLAAALFNNYTKFMVVRHPFDRLVSAYRNKFAVPESRYRYTRGRQIAIVGLQKYLGANHRIDLKREKMPALIHNITTAAAFKKLSESNKEYVLDLARRAFAGDITFEEFLRYGIVFSPVNARYFDVHWRPQHMLCNPCAINFDFVVRFENLAEESKHLLDYLQRFEPKDRRIEFPSSRTSAVTNSVTKEFFKNIPQQVIKTITQIYEKDFQYFNYHPNYY